MKTSIPVYSNTPSQVPATSGILATLFWSVASTTGNGHSGPINGKNNIFHLPTAREAAPAPSFFSEKTATGFEDRPFPPLSNISLIGHVDTSITRPWLLETGLDLSGFVPTELVSTGVLSPSVTCGRTAIRSSQATDTTQPYGMSVWLIGFTANTQGNNIVLDWETYYELDNEGFGIERSTDTQSWQKIGSVEGQGFTIGAQHYSFTDDSPLPGMNYYRLRQADSEGTAGYSEIAAVSTNGSSRGFNLAPNPKLKAAAVLIESYHFGKGELAIYNLRGRCVRKKIFLMDGSLIRTSIDLSELPTGIYLLEVKEGARRWQKLVVANNG